MAQERGCVTTHSVCHKLRSPTLCSCPVLPPLPLMIFFLPSLIPLFAGMVSPIPLPKVRMELIICGEGSLRARLATDQSFVGGVDGGHIAT